MKSPIPAHDSMKASRGIMINAHSGGFSPRKSFSSSKSVLARREADKRVKDSLNAGQLYWRFEHR